MEAGYAYLDMFDPPIPFTPDGRVKQYSHILGGHRSGEADALAYASTQGNGPFHVSLGKRALYASTLIQGNSPLGVKWNLRMTNGYQRDATAFWRINDEGAKLVRLDVWPVGAVQQQRMSMQDALERGSRIQTGEGGGCFGCA